MSKETEYRIEYDSIGEEQVPKDAHYGVQTLRTTENFFITGLKTHPEFINNFTQVKKVTTITNFEARRSDKKRVDVVVQACDEIMSGKLHDESTVDPIQSGTGTPLNMNANEVTANWAIEILGGERGDYSVVSPSDHVNYGQSTNDVFLSCGKLTTLKLLCRAQAELERLCHTLMEKSKEFSHVIRTGRTQFQDAVPIRLGQEFHTYAAAIRKDINRFDRAREEMRHLNLGRAAIGTGLNADVKYLQQAVKNISSTSGLELIRAYDLVGTTQNLDDYVTCSGIAKSYVVNLPEMRNDLGLISSGPKTGLGEINLPAKQNGSSIMPGKVNPVVPEVVGQVAFHIIGNDVAVTMTVEAGQLELNAFKPIIFCKLFQSVETIAYVVHTLVDNCISRIAVNEQHRKDMVENSVGIITAICPYMGCERAANVAKETIRTGKSVGELVIKDKLLIEEQLDIILNLVSMTEPGISGIEAMNKMGGL